MPNRKTGYTLNDTDTSLADDYVGVMLRQTKAGMRKAEAAATTEERRAALFEHDHLENRIDDEEFCRFLLRIIRSAEGRAAANPAVLALLVEAADRLGEAVNVAAAYNALTFRENPLAAASSAEIAAVLGISKPSMSSRIAHGLAAMSERVEAAGITRHAEAARERKMVERMRGRGVVVLADFRDRKARGRQQAAAPVATTNESKAV